MGRLISILESYGLTGEEIANATMDAIIETVKLQEETKMKMFDKPLKVFVSQPMYHRNYIDIYTERQRVISKTLSYLKAQNIIPEDLKPDDIQIIDNYNKPQKLKDAASNKEFPRMYLLGDSVQLMAGASFVIFVPGCDSAKGCEIERTICDLYNVPTVLIMDDEKETIVLENFPK